MMNQELKEAFKHYCERKGLILLRDDYNYIERQLSRCPSKLHKSILKRYILEWVKLPESSDDGSQKQNGRFRANSWLRHAVQKINNGASI